MDNYYQILGIENYCSNQEKIKKAYRTQIKFFHPDSNNVSAEMSDIKTKQLNIAYDCLSDKKKKEEYDSQLHLELKDNINSNSTNNHNKSTYKTNNEGNNTFTTSKNFTRNKYINETETLSEIYKEGFKWYLATLGVLLLFLAIIGKGEFELDGTISLSLGIGFFFLVFTPGFHRINQAKKESKGIIRFEGKSPNLAAQIADITIKTVGNKGDRWYRFRITFEDGFIYIKTVRPDNTEVHIGYSTFSLSPKAQLVAINEAIEKHKEYCNLNKEQYNDAFDKQAANSNNSDTSSETNKNKENNKFEGEDTKKNSNNKKKDNKTENKKEQFKFCRYCGSKLNDNEIYCRKCGKRVN